MEIQLALESRTLTLPDEGLNCNTLEELVLGFSRAAGCEIMKQVLEQADALLLEHRAKSLKVVNLRERTLNTRMGEVRFRRRCYRDEQGEYHFLLDELLGLEKHQRYSDGFLLEGLRQASQRSYRQSAGELGKQTSTTVSHETLRQQVKMVGGSWNAVSSAQVDAVLERGEVPDLPGMIPNRLFVESDGTNLSVRSEGKVHKAEMKLGIWYTGCEPRYSMGKRDTFQLTGKHAFGGMYTGDEMRERLAVLGELRVGLSHVPELFFGGDGAAWCTSIAKDYPQAIFHLCKFHVNRAIRRTFGSDHQACRELSSLLYRADLAGTQTFMASKIYGTNGMVREKRQNLQSYLLNNWDGIVGWQKVNAALGSVAHGHLGAMEGNVDKLGVRRFTDRGACWSVDGAHALAQVRLAWQNGELKQTLSWLTIKGRRVVVESPEHRAASRPAGHHFWRQVRMPALHIALSKPWQMALKNIRKERMP